IYIFLVGLYVGVWGLGVDFGDGSLDFEVDYFIGYGVDVSLNVNFDVMFNYYSYLGVSDLVYIELIIKIIFVEYYNFIGEV
ncbi:hypothetical protein GUF79_25770, partial [Xanthomonas citri pv. citri]|nr:hypothetical protein [Xanthomonas citri pv. citri]